MRGVQAQKGVCSVIGQSLRLTRRRRSGKAIQEVPCVRYNTAWAVRGVWVPNNPTSAALVSARCPCFKA